MAIFSVFSLAELILCKSCLRFMSNFASAKNRNAAEEKKKKRSFQYCSLTMGYWWEICTQLIWNQTQQFLSSRLSVQTEVYLAYCIQTICILRLVQTEVAQAYSCFTGSLQNHKLPTIITALPQPGNLEVCRFCGQTPSFRPKFLICSHQKACRQGKSGSVGHWSCESGERERNPLFAHSYVRHCAWSMLYGCLNNLSDLSKGWIWS